MSSHNRKSHAINNMPREWALQWPKKYPLRFELEITNRIAGILESPFILTGCICTVLLFNEIGIPFLESCLAAEKKWAFWPEKWAIWPEKKSRDDDVQRRRLREAPQRRPQARR